MIPGRTTTMIRNPKTFTRAAAVAAALALLPFALPSELAATAVWYAADDSARSSDYRSAQKLLSEGKYDEALDRFRAIADARKADADAALYWLAWTEWKLARKGSARGTLRTLYDAYPTSVWIDDARVLELQIDGRSALVPPTPPSPVTPPSPPSAASRPTAPVPPVPPTPAREPREPREPKHVRESGHSEQDELKLYALDGLMHVEPERALPILEKFLAGNHSLKLKERALFVLAQSDAPKARQVLLDLVRRGTPPELRLSAVEQLGVAGGTDDLEALATIWKEATPEVKQKVLEAWMIAGAEQPVFDIAKSERDPELRRKAIEMLGVMGASKELGQLYATETDRDVRGKLLEAYGIAGDEEALLRAAKGERDPGLRRKAIESIGIFGGKRAATILAELYETETDRDLKARIVESLMIAGDAKPLVALFKKEQDRELKRKILQQIAIMGDEETAELFGELLEERQ